jgi:hypothetical protein
MRKPIAALVALIIVLVLLIAVAYGWYNYTGWQPFSYATNDVPAWHPLSGQVARLRFKDAKFTVTRLDGVQATYDVTAVLNGMSTAYTGSITGPPALTLTRPLNPFSFVIPGFNDRTTVADPTSSLWCTSPPASCSSDAQCPGGGAGACSCSGDKGVCAPNVAGTCYGCPGGAKVTLTGKWRTI